MGDIWTVGHSNHPQDKFIELLTSNGIRQLVDVRSYPGSRYAPQFAAGRLASLLRCEGVAYMHLVKLGGRRGRQSVDPKTNMGWVNSSFRNFAGYTQTADFIQGLESLKLVADRKPTAFMCAEALPWRCHRLLISNVLVTQYWNVKHIMSTGDIIDHHFGGWGAKPFLDQEGHVTYPKPSKG